MKLEDIAIKELNRLSESDLMRLHNAACEFYKCDAGDYIRNNCITDIEYVFNDVREFYIALRHGSYGFYDDYFTCPKSFYSFDLKDVRGFIDEGNIIRFLLDNQSESIWNDFGIDTDGITMDK